MTSNSVVGVGAGSGVEGSVAGVGAGTGDDAGVSLGRTISVCDGASLETAVVSGTLAHDDKSGIIIAVIINSAHNPLIFFAILSSVRSESSCYTGTARPRPGQTPQTAITRGCQYNVNL